MDSVIYQLHHPWHWLTYGQNATALAAVAAVAGLIGLYFYTLYTRQMMRLQERTSRASITPVLISRGGVAFQATGVKHTPASEIGLIPGTVYEYQAVLDVRNIGEGVALFLNAWCQPVSEAFNANDSTFLIKTSQSSLGQHEFMELFKGQETKVAFQGFAPEDLHRRFLFVVEALDQSNGHHQLKIVRSGLPSGETSVTMAHRTGETVGERIAALAGRYVEILNAIKRQSDKLDD
jgi:hypothetical protein